MLPGFSVQEIQDALDQISALHRGDQNFISVSYTKYNDVRIRYRDAKKRPRNLPKSIKMFSQSENAAYDVSVLYSSGPTIIPSIGRTRVDPVYASKLTTRTGAPWMGGDYIRNVDLQDWGTTTFFVASIAISYNGLCQGQCKAAPALLSCSHVLDPGEQYPIGSSIETDTNDVIAQLNCTVPLKCRSNKDVGLATVNDINQVDRWTVREIGYLGDVRAPKIGELVQKFGARTGYTTGTILAQTNIIVNDIEYDGVFQVAGGFSCPGDSGSCVVGSDKGVLGVLSWGDNISCDQKPTGYFWILQNMGMEFDSSIRSDVTREFVAIRK